MSFFDRLGQVAKDVAGFVAAPAKFAWDVGTAPWNNDEHFNGFANTLASASKNLGTSLVKPVADVAQLPVISGALNTINTVNQNLIREPLTTLNLVAADAVSGKASFFDPNEWKKAYTGAQTISFGQSIVGGVKEVTDKNFNIYDPAQREDAFKKSTFGRYTSGLLDTGIDFAGDVTIGLGKGLKVLKASEYGVGAIRTAEEAAKAAEEITKVQYGNEQNRFTKVVKDFTNNGSEYALSHPMVKSSHEPGLLASLLGESKNEETTARILRASLGDPAAMEELALSRADIVQSLNKANQELDAVDKFKMSPVQKFGQEMVTHLWEDPAVVAEAKAARDAAIANNTFVSNLLQLGAGGGSLTRTTGSSLQGVEDFIARQRAANFYKKTAVNPVIKFYQQTPFHRMYQVISHPEGERPAGLVDLNDANSYKEIVATIDRGQALKVLNEQASKSHLDRYIAASNPEERKMAAFILENDIFTGLAAKHGISTAQAQDIIREVNSARDSAIRKIKEDTFMVDHDKSLVHAPVFESQTADFLPMADFDLWNHLFKQHGNALTQLSRTKDTIVHYADIVQDGFKAAALLRGGYTIRNGIDSQLRIIASVGAMASVRNLGEGMKNLMFNRIPMPTRLVDNFTFATGKTVRTAQIAEEAKALKAELDASKLELSKLEQQVKVNPNDAGTISDIGTLRNLIEEKQAIYDHQVNTVTKYGSGKKIQLGDGVIEKTTSDGQKYNLYDAFGGELGDMFRKFNSSATTFSRLVDTNSDLIGRKLASKGIGAIHPGDTGYYSEWARTLNQQFANSAPIRQLAAGVKPEKVIDWLRHSPEGIELRKRLPKSIGKDAIDLSYQETPAYVAKINDFLDNYLSAEHGALREKLAKRQPITEEELRAAHVGLAEEELPVIHGNVLKENINNHSLISIRSVTDKLFKFLGSMPEDAWARHPLYRELYRDEVQRRLDIMSGLKKDRLTPAEQQQVMSRAHDFAQDGVKKILFNIERRTNLATALKYVSPFFSAQENAIKTWLRIGAENPVVVNRANMIWNAPNRSGLVTDQNGKPVAPGKTGTGDTIWLEMPNWTKRIPIFGPGFEALNQQGISKQSLDVVFGGGMSAVFGGTATVPFNDVIPVGPYVAIPASELVKRAPQFEDVFKWALPFGPTKGPAYEGLMPAWMKRAQTLMAGQNSAEYARTYQLIHTTEMHKARDNGTNPPTDATIKKMTDNYYKMRIAANLILPYSPKFDSPYRMYMDKYRQYQQQYPGLGEADAKFLQDFGPTFFDFATSLSSNKTGISATQSAYTATKRYGDLISSVYQDNPALASLITNTKGDTAFSQAVYDWQYNTQVGPGTADTFRSVSNAQDAEKQNKVKLGWIQYRNVMNQVDAVMHQRGLLSINQKGAEDLKAIKQATVNALSVERDAKNQPILDANGQPTPSAWLLAYNDPNGSKTQQVISGLTKMTANNEQFWKDHQDSPTWKAVKTYLQVRNQLSNVLASRQSKSITAKANADVAGIYEAVVTALKKDVQFGDIYDRYLSQDQVYYKYISDIAAQQAAQQQGA